MGQSPRQSPNQASGTPEHQPSNPRIWMFEGFDTLNTKPSRPAIGDQEMSWCKNFMPIGKNNLRTLYDVGSNLYTTTGGTTICFYSFFGITTAAQDEANIPGHEYLIVFRTDGSMACVDLTTNTGVVGAVAGTFNVNPLPAVAQWGNKYLLIATQETSNNGYWMLDGSASLYKAGGIGPVVTIVGNGNNYTSAPTVTAYGGSGTGATFTSTIKDGAVDTVSVTSPGTGYVVGDAVGLAFSGGGNGTQTAILVAGIQDGQVVSTSISHAGSGYTSEATAKFVGGGGSGAQATLQITGAIGSATITNGGVNYSAATATITGANGTGSGATATVTGTNGAITSIVITAPGSGYQSPVDIAISGGSGTGASATATVVNGTVTNVQMTSTGSGYTSMPTVLISDSNSQVGIATVNPMPFGVEGTSIETYQERAWIINGDKCVYTSPGDPSDLDTTNGAGAFKSTDSFLRQAFTRVVQSNGFLYTVADSSINSISGVTTGGGPPVVTTFSNQNVDPQIGSIWVNSIQVYSRAVILANGFGIHALYGGAVQKVSTPLDGILANLPNLTGFSPSAAIATVFGVHVYMILLPITDPITGVYSNVLFMWDGKRWWVADQSKNLTFVQTRNLNSNLTAYGCDGTNIFPLFQVPSVTTVSTVQSKLWNDPHIFLIKRFLRQAGLFQNLDSGAASVQISLDSENTPVSYTYNITVPPTGVTETYRSLMGADGAGTLMGFTISTNANDLILIAYGATGQDMVKQV